MRDEYARHQQFPPAGSLLAVGKHVIKSVMWIGHGKVRAACIGCLAGASFFALGRGHMPCALLSLPGYILGADGLRVARCLSVLLHSYWHLLSCLVWSRRGASLSWLGRTPTQEEPLPRSGFHTWTILSSTLIAWRRSSSSTAST